MRVGNGTRGCRKKERRSDPKSATHSHQTMPRHIIIQSYGCAYFHLCINDGVIEAVVASGLNHRQR